MGKLDIFKDVRKIHKVWNRFNKYIKQKGWDIDNLQGYEVQEDLKSFIQREKLPIDVIKVDDDVYASSYVFVIPHKNHGTTLLFVPQCTEVKNRFFMYPNHLERLLNSLKKQ